MDTAEIRRRFIAHFEKRDHTVVPSASLLLDDPNLLFVNAGMVPFVPYFLGQETAPYARAVSVQKCIRTLDIEEVGKTDRHGTFFQMNGNFSFGDYFKEGAIEAAWDLVTKPQSDGGYGIDESVLHVSVYLDDDESVAIWKRVAGLADDRIHRLGMAENYWSMGIPGPCGPDSELFVDRGEAYGPERHREGRRPVHGVLEPRLHAEPARRGHGQGQLRDPRRPAEEEHRHRHGSRADGDAAAGQGQHLRDRRGLPGPGEGGRARGQDATAPTTTTTSGCASWPTTSAAR